MSSKIKVGSIAVALFIASVATIPSASAAPPDDACSLFTQAQVSDAFGFSVLAASIRTLQELKMCMWPQTNAAAEDRYSVTISLQTADDYDKSRPRMEQEEATMKEEGDEGEDGPEITLTNASGVGDDAYYYELGQHINLNVKKGRVSLIVEFYAHVPSEKAKAAEKALALQIIPKL